MHLSRLPILTVLMFGAAALLSPLARAEIRVTYPGGGDTVITDAQLRDEFDLATNMVRWWPSGPTAPVLFNVRGMSAAEVVRRAGVDPASLRSTAAMTIGGPGTDMTETLSRTEVTDVFPDIIDPGNAAGGGYAAFVPYGGLGEEQRVDFIRPLRTAAEATIPGATRFSFSRGITVTLAIAGRVLPVSITAPSSAKAKRDVLFSADGGVPAGVAFNWDFGDGGTSSTAAPVHRYATAGTYKVRLTIDDGSGGRGVATKILTIAGVGAAGDNDDDATTPESSADPPATAPSDDGSGTALRDASVLGSASTTRRAPRNAAGARKAARSAARAHTGQPAAPGAASGRGTGGGGSGGASAIGSSGSAGVNGTQTGSTTTAAGAAGRERQPNHPGAVGGDPIVGVLLTGSGNAIAIDRSATAIGANIVAPRDQTAARAGRGESPDWPAWTGGALVLVALAAAGVAREALPACGPRLVYP